MSTPRRARLHLQSAFPEGYEAMLAFDHAVASGGLERPLLELIRTRASQINGCAFCIDMHTKDAIALGESSQRLLLLAAWRETDLFTERERAALALTEAVTLVAGRGIHDSDIEEARRVFSEEELTRVVFAISAINTWNRLSISAGGPVGRYVSPLGPAVEAPARG